MQIRKDMFGKEPIIGDIIVYNPPHYKGLISGIVKSFSSTGLPIIDAPVRWNPSIIKENTPKTGFAIINR